MKVRGKSLLRASALALALAICGFGGKASADGKSGTGGGSADAGGASTQQFSPRVAQDAVMAVGLNLDKEVYCSIVDYHLDKFFPELIKEIGKASDDGKEFEQGLAEVKAAFAKFKKDPLKDAPEDVRSFVEETGIFDAKSYWAVLSIGEPTFKDGYFEPKFMPDAAVAIATEIKLDALLRAIEKRLGGVGSFKEGKVGKETAWHFVANDPRIASEFGKAHVDPWYTSLDGKLIVAATSHAVLEKQIGLYREGSGQGNLLAGFKPSEGGVLCTGIKDVGKWAGKKLTRRDLRKISREVPDGDKIVLGLKDFVMTMSASKEGATMLDVRLETASEKDADSLITLAKTGQMSLVSEIKKQSDPQKLTDMIEAWKIERKGTSVEAYFSAGGLLFGALFPAVSSARLSANASAFSMRGRMFFQGIIQANIEREGAGLDKVWPRTKIDGKASDDIASMSFSDSTSYFNALFDMKNYGTAKWAPYVDGDILRALGKDAVDGKRIRAGGIDWIIAADVKDETPDFMPVLITANFNPTLLLNKWDGVTDASKKLPIGPESGAVKSMLGDKAIVIVRKGGASEVIKAKYLTYQNLYHGQTFDNSKSPLKYLTPNGVVTPKN